MNKQVQWKYHPSNPANQPFKGSGRPNQTKKNSWWNASSDRYWRNARKVKKTKNAATDNAE